jgi:hypothetical protein
LGDFGIPFKGLIEFNLKYGLSVFTKLYFCIGSVLPYLMGRGLPTFCPFPF